MAGANANLESTIFLAADDTNRLATQHTTVTKPITIRYIFDAVTRLMHCHIAAFAKNDLIVIQAFAEKTNAANSIFTS
jgi:hypothetical protein